MTILRIFNWKPDENLLVVTVTIHRAGSLMQTRCWYTQINLGFAVFTCIPAKNLDISDNIPNTINQSRILYSQIHINQAELKRPWERNKAWQERLVCYLRRLTQVYIYTYSCWLDLHILQSLADHMVMICSHQCQSGNLYLWIQACIHIYSVHKE